MLHIQVIICALYKPCVEMSFTAFEKLNLLTYFTLHKANINQWISKTPETNNYNKNKIDIAETK